MRLRILVLNMYQTQGPTNTQRGRLKDATITGKRAGGGRITAVQEVREDRFLGKRRQLQSGSPTA